MKTVARISISPVKAFRLSHPDEVELGPDARGALQLAPLGLRVEPVQLDRLRLGLFVAVDPDDHALAGLDLLRVAERGLVDLALD